MASPEWPVDEFFTRQGDVRLEYEDVMVESDHTKIQPKHVNLTTRFSRRIVLAVPLVIAPMDTTCDSAMAITAAQEGGMGVIHRNMTPERQRFRVAKVKCFRDGRIDHPVTVRDDQQVAEVLRMRATVPYDFYTFPVVNAARKLVGLLTKNHFDFCRDDQLLVRDVMTRNVLTARKGISHQEAQDIMYGNLQPVLPLVSSSGEVIAMIELSHSCDDEEGKFSHQNLDGYGRLRVAAAIGSDMAELERVQLLVEVGVDAVVVDKAHADTGEVRELLSALKRDFPTIDIMVGNIANPKSAERLVEWGADAIRVGQSSGQACITRNMTGVWSPQLSAVYRCAKAIRGSEIPVCADGGIRCPGEILYALVAGAHNAMFGQLVAGTDQAPGEVIVDEAGQTVAKKYRGMGSVAAMKDGLSWRYEAPSSSEGRIFVPEGIEKEVPYQGDAHKRLAEAAEGVRIGMVRTGCSTIQELQRKVTFARAA